MASETQKEVTQSTEEVNNVTVIQFPLMTMPVDYQLTIHINNMINTYGVKIINTFKDYLHSPETLTDEQGYAFGTRTLINHYGVEACKNWFTLIYGWDFKKKSS